MKEALALLSKNDTVLSRIIAENGAFTLEVKRNRFESLCQAIIYQQLSMKAAAGIYKRFRALHRWKISPQRTLSLKKTSLRKVGLSERKIEYIRDLAGKFSDGTIDARRLGEMSDVEVIETLTKVRGIGEWTSHMFLIFSLGRFDVLPIGDLGFRRAVMEAYGLESIPSDEQLLAISERWRPYRTVAAWYLWRSADKGIEY